MYLKKLSLALVAVVTMNCAGSKDPGDSKLMTLERASGKLILNQDKVSTSSMLKSAEINYTIYADGTVLYHGDLSYVVQIYEINPSFSKSYHLPQKFVDAKELKKLHVDQVIDIGVSRVTIKKMNLEENIATIKIKKNEDAFSFCRDGFFEGTAEMDLDLSGRIVKILRITGEDVKAAPSDQEERSYVCGLWSGVKQTVQGLLMPLDMFELLGE